MVTTFDVAMRISLMKILGRMKKKKRGEGGGEKENRKKSDLVQNMIFLSNYLCIYLCKVFNKTNC